MNKKGRSKAAIAAEFGMSPMTIGRFLKSGRVIDANKYRIEIGLARAGGWPPDGVDLPSDIFGSDNDKVIRALEFLLAAARQHAKRSSGS